jgi:geranyl-CoA carboxylase alpha subunit
MLIRKILIANRGEIACRIMRTCREMGIASVAIYSDADANALHVEQADEAVHIGASPARESYLNAQAIFDAAKRTGADAIHPGFGFLAENADFAHAVIDAELIWIGPPPSAIAAMGKKRESKWMLKGIPLVPGYSGSDQSDAALIQAANESGFPIMVKASAGGGGKGMRAVHSADDLPDSLAAARREALQSFGDDTLILERLVPAPRHVEVQIFGDQHGNVVALGERECTLQRRHQKIIEETPSTALTPELREKMLAAAVRIGKQLNYASAGTVEFLVDADRNFYFMEMNTRLQVEHPVTEMVTGADLVRWQILIAQGEPLPTLYVNHPYGHAIEARVYAEDPANGFLPTTGKILRWREPPEIRIRTEDGWQWSAVRVDSGIRSGDEVSLYYDPMLAKIVAWGATREEAIRRLDYGLSQTQLLGLKNNIAFLRRALLHPDHLAGDITTQFIDDHPELLADDDNPTPLALIAAGIANEIGASSVRKTGVSGYWRNNFNCAIRQVFTHDNREYDVLLTPQSDGKRYYAKIGERAYQVEVIVHEDHDLTLVVDGHRQPVTVLCGTDEDWWVQTANGTTMLRWVSPLPTPGERRAGEGALHAPMPGKIVAVTVEVGQQVEKGAVLMTLEAMKMEHRIQAPYSGTVQLVHYKVGDSVQADAILLELIATEKN